MKLKRHHLNPPDPAAASTASTSSTNGGAKVVTFSDPATGTAEPDGSAAAPAETTSKTSETFTKS